ncbi:MAG TPA: 4Fe-4S dicluster domain-containing protein [Steroidobacteraceae bacterium]|nr:4Fe-4S dicluster domain-containing protein [Steroidobacteraceae bacterium]
MTRYIMIADLRRCVGCQTCTAACKLTNATPPEIQWRRVLDLESGEYPDVRRTFVPVSCMHCGDPPCLDVCPTGATFKRDDGLVRIDAEICIGCAYCAVACPYQQRHIVKRREFAYGVHATAAEDARFDPRSIAVSTKCTFCSDRVDQAASLGLTPGVDPEVTPACVNSCIAGALHFGDRDDPGSNVSQLLAHSVHFRMQEELNTDPGFYYIAEGRP